MSQWKRLVAAVFVSISFTAASLLLWCCFKDYTLCWSENSKHLLLAYAFANSSSFAKSLQVTTTYPPFVYAITSLFFKATSFSEDTAYLSLIPFPVIGMAGVYLIARKFCHTEIAIAASFITGAQLIFYIESFGYLLEAPLAAMTAFGIGTLINTNYFKSSAYSALFGLATGFGMLTKWTYPVYLLFPFCIIAALTLKTAKKRQIARMIKAILLAAAIFLPWYYMNWNGITMHIISSNISEIKAPPQFTSQYTGPLYLSAARAAEDIIALISDSPIPSIVCLIGIITLFRQSHLTATALLLTAVVPVLIFSTIPSQDMRYYYPLLGIIAIMEMLSLNILKKYRIAASSAIIILFAIYVWQWIIPSNILQDIPKAGKFISPADVLASRYHSAACAAAKAISSSKLRGFTPILYDCEITESQYQWYPLLNELYLKMPKILSINEKKELIYIYLPHLQHMQTSSIPFLPQQKVLTIKAFKCSVPFHQSAEKISNQLLAELRCNNQDSQIFINKVKRTSPELDIVAYVLTSCDNAGEMNK